MKARFKKSDFRNGTTISIDEADGWLTNGHWLIKCAADPARFGSAETLRAAFGIDARTLPDGSGNKVLDGCGSDEYVRTSVTVDMKAGDMVARLYRTKAGALVAVNVDYLRIVGEPERLFGKPNGGLRTSESDACVMPVRVDLPEWFSVPEQSSAVA